MIPVLHTRDLESCARALAGRFPRVLIRNKNNLWNPIRLRVTKIQDLAPYMVRSPPEFDSELLAWNAKGGIAVFDRAHRRDENVAAHHAQLVSETPLSRDMLEGYIEGTRELVVIYKPPNWRGHEQTVHDKFPPAFECHRFFDLAKSSPTSETIRKALRLPELFTVRSDESMCDTLGIGKAQFAIIRAATLRPREFRSVMRVACRIEPDEHYLKPTYNHILGHCPEIDGWFHIEGNILSKVSRFWKKTLRGLVRSGNIQYKDTLGIYLFDGLEPDWDRIQEDHDKAVFRLQEMVKFVEELDEFK